MTSRLKQICLVTIVCTIGVNSVDIPTSYLAAQREYLASLVSPITSYFRRRDDDYDDEPKYSNRRVSYNTNPTKYETVSTTPAPPPYQQFEPVKPVNEDDYLKPSRGYQSQYEYHRDNVYRPKPQKTYNAPSSPPPPPPQPQQQPHLAQYPVYDPIYFGSSGVESDLNQNVPTTNERFGPSVPSNQRPSSGDVYPSQGKVNTTNSQKLDPWYLSGQSSKSGGNERQNVTVNRNPPKPHAVAVTKFGLNLLRTISQSQTQNVAVSPLSIALMLSLVQQGTRDDAQAQISQALGMNQRDSATAFQSMITAIKNRKSRNLLQIATGLFVSNVFNLDSDFKSTAIRTFNSEVKSINYRNPEVAAQRINLWVGKKTGNNIEELISPVFISESTQIVMANAVFFKGLWQSMFHTQSTVPRQFHLASGETKMTPFMRLRRPFKTATDAALKLKYVILPFDGEQYSFMLLLPNEDQQLSTVINQLDEVTLANYHNIKSKEVELEIPKFKVRSDVNLKQVLNSMEVKDIFLPRLSKLDGIGDYEGIAPQITSAVHTAMLTIDEQGGSAAAATAFAVVALSYDEPDMDFKANRPFLGVLWDNELEIPMFIVKVEDPTL